MTIDDILFCLMDVANDLSRTYSPYLKEKYRLKQQTAAIKEVVSLLRLIQRAESVDLTLEPDGLCYEAWYAHEARIGMMMKEADSDAGVH